MKNSPDALVSYVRPRQKAGERAPRFDRNGFLAEMREWRRRFEEAERDEEKQRRLQKELRDFGAKCTRAGNLIRTLLEHPALSTEARLWISEQRLGPTAVRESRPETGSAEYERALSQAIEALVSKDNGLSGALAELERLAAHANAAAEHAPTPTRGAPRRDAKFEATVQLAAIFEKHNTARATRTGDFRSFVGAAFAWAGIQGWSAHVQSALKWRAKNPR